MHSIRFPSVFVLFLLGACTASAPPPFTQAQRDSLATEVREFVAELTEAMNSHNPDRFLSLFRDSEEFVYMGCTDPMFGFQSFATRVAPYYRSNTDVIFQQEILRVQVLSPTTAVVALRGSSTEADALFWTEVLVKGEDGRWLIAHEHESWPGCPEPDPLHPTGSFEDLGGEGGEGP